MKTKLFVDFDGTIFDSHKFSDKIFEIFQKAGFEIDEIKASYQAEYLNYKYSPWNNILRLSKLRKFNTEMAKARLEKVFLDAPSLVWPDSIDFLKKIDRDNYETNLLTLGDIRYQKRKIKESGIEDYFDNIYCTEIQKWQYLNNLVSEKDRFVFIDDRGDAAEEIMKRFKKSLAIEINRTKDPIDPMEGPDTFSGIKVKNLMQALKYL